MDRENEVEHPPFTCSLTLALSLISWSFVFGFASFWIPTFSYLACAFFLLGAVLIVLIGSAGGFDDG